MKFIIFFTTLYFVNMLLTLRDIHLYENYLYTHSGKLRLGLAILTHLLFLLLSVVFYSLIR